MKDTCTRCGDLHPEDELATFIAEFETTNEHEIMHSCLCHDCKRIMNEFLISQLGEDTPLKRANQAMCDAQKP